KVHAGPDLEFMLYGIAGPFGSLKGKLRLNHQNNSWEIYGGFGASLGVKMEVFKRGASLQFREIINYERLLAEGNPPPADSLIIQPGSEGKDAYVSHLAWSNGSHDYYGYGDTELLEILRDFPSTYGTEKEALIEFPLSGVPSNADISSAKLRVYGYAISNYINQLATITLSKLTSSWNESNVKWNTRPSRTRIRNMDFVYEGATSWYEFDVTDAVRSWINGEANYGFGFSTTENEVGGKIHSSDNSDATKRPMLKVYYH
ncbi:MAG: DNRLRE domain-containing protein, partial [Nanoarchaeota archaeon]